MKYGHCIRFSEYQDCAALGYDFAEINGMELMDLDDAAFDAVCKELSAGPIPCPASNMYSDARLPMVGPNFDPEQVKAYAAKFAARASRLGVKMVGIGSPKSRLLPEGFPIETAHAQMLEFLTITCKELENYGMCGLLEGVNHTLCNYLNKTNAILDMVARANIPNLGYLLDICHMVPEGEALSNHLTALAGAGHFHIAHAEVSGRRGTLTEADAAFVRQIGACMDKAGYDGYVSVEAGGPDFLQHGAISLQVMKKYL